MKRILFTVLTLLVAVLLVCAITTPVQAEPPAVDKPTTAVSALPVAPEPQEDYENEKIEAALQARSTKLENVTVTHYDLCAACCGKTDGLTASGVKATPGVTVAVDRTIIPLGADVLIDWGGGNIQYCRADDVGGAIKGNHIDLCTEDHASAISAGVKTATVWYIPI